MADTSFEYTRTWHSAEDFPYLGFTRNWENPVDYPTFEPDEAVVRADMQSLHDETKKYINETLIPEMLAADATEKAREEAEATRVANERARVAAEQARENETSGIVARATEQAELAKKYAEAAVGTVAGVASFNGRDGLVMPQAGDYTAEQVGAAPAGYGYGEYLETVSAASAAESYETFCAKLDSIISTMGAQRTKQVRIYPPQIYGRGTCVGRIYKHDSNDYAGVEAWLPYDSEVSSFRMRKEAGIWQPIEWTSPPIKSTSDITAGNSELKYGRSYHVYE